MSWGCLHIISGEILGYQGENDKMIAAIEMAQERFDAMALLETSHTGGESNPTNQQPQPPRISRHSLASVYHKLATSYLTTRELIPLSLPLLDKALGIAPGRLTIATSIVVIVAAVNN